LARQITHVRKSGPENDCSCITNVKLASDETGTVQQIINLIQQKNQFYVVDPKDNSKVIVNAVPENNPTYIRTQANDTSDDNLLQLPTF